MQSKNDYGLDRLFMARVAEQAYKYEDMFVYVKDMINAKTSDFTIEERNLMAVAFKNQVVADRKAIKTVQDIYEFEKFAQFQPVLMTLRRKI